MVPRLEYSSREATLTELITPINHFLSSIPNSCGKLRFAPLAPVLSHPWIADPSEHNANYGEVHMPGKMPLVGDLSPQQGFVLG